MVKIEKGGVYKAHRVRSGTSRKGDWELIAVKGLGDDRREITVYVENHPSHVREGDPFVVTDIVCVTVKAYQDEEGNWTRNKMYINAMVETALPVNPVADLGYDETGGLL